MYFLLARIRLVAAISAVIIASAETTLADLVNFTVGGTTYNVAKFDETPGNVLAVNAETAIAAAAPGTASAPFTVYYQANVNLEDANGRSLGIPGQVTVLAKFNEFAITSVVNGQTQSNFFLANNAPAISYFNFYYSPTAVSSDANGTGFNAGTLIYSAAFGNPGSSSGQFQISMTGTTLFDQSQSQSPFGNKQTLIGNGSSTLNLTTTSFNSSIFTGGLAVGGLLNFTSTNQTPFGAANPSVNFLDTQTPMNMTPSLPTVNGQYQVGGPARQDFQFLADGNSFFVNPTVIPEPASVVMTVLGLGGMGLAVARRRLPRTSSR